MNKKKGITLVEVIVAMAITVIVSAAAFITCDYSLSIENKNKIKSFFINQAQSFVQCYYLGSEKYSDAMELLTGTSYVYGQDAQIYYSKTFEFSTQQNASYTAKLTFKESSFLVECFSSSNLVYEIEV